MERKDYGTDTSPIDAILVFSDSSNWYLDLQLMYDLILSGKEVLIEKTATDTETVMLDLQVRQNTSIIIEPKDRH